MLRTSARIGKRPLFCGEYISGLFSGCLRRGSRRCAAGKCEQTRWAVISRSPVACIAHAGRFSEWQAPGCAVSGAGGAGGTRRAAPCRVCDRTSSTVPVKSSASSSDRSSSDSNPCSRPVDTMNCRPGRWRCRCRQVNRRTGTHPATGTSPRSRTAHATSPFEVRHVPVHRRGHPGPRPRRFAFRLGPVAQEQVIKPAAIRPHQHHIAHGHQERCTTERNITIHLVKRIEMTTG